MVQLNDWKDENCILFKAGFCRALCKLVNNLGRKRH